MPEYQQNKKAAAFLGGYHKASFPAFHKNRQKSAVFFLFPPRSSWHMLNILTKTLVINSNVFIFLMYSGIQQKNLLKMNPTKVYDLFELSKKEKFVSTKFPATWQKLYHTICSRAIQLIFPNLAFQAQTCILSLAMPKQCPVLRYQVKSAIYEKCPVFYWTVFIGIPERIYGHSP